MLLSSFSSLAVAAVSLSGGGVILISGVRVAVDGGLAGVTDMDKDLGGDDDEDEEVLHVSWLAKIARSTGWMFSKPR